MVFSDQGTPIPDKQLACVLEETAKWVRDPDSPKSRRNWAKDSQGDSCDPLDQDAVSWCAIGQVSHVTRVPFGKIMDLISTLPGGFDIAGSFDREEDEQCAMALERAAGVLTSCLR